MMQKIIPEPRRVCKQWTHPLRQQQISAGLQANLSQQQIRTIRPAIARALSVVMKVFGLKASNCMGGVGMIEKGCIETGGEPQWYVLWIHGENRKLGYENKNGEWKICEEEEARGLVVTDKKPADFYIQRSLIYIIMIGFHGIARNRKSK
jgi:hypothetical protein